MNDIISIVVPVYNVKDYIDRCLNSLVLQTYNDIEIILIDDGSTDGSSSKCDEWAKKDSRIKVIHKSNGGVSSARNIGIKESTGKYILFFDSDDWVEELTCETLVEYVSSESMVLFDAYFVEKERTYKKFNYDWNEKNDSNDIKRSFVHGLLGWTNCWNKLFISEIIKKNNLLFDENLKIGEDYLFTYEYLKHITNVKYCNEALYYYDLTRDSSAMNTKSEALLKKWIATEMILKEEFENVDIYESILKKLLDELFITACQAIKTNREDIYNVIVKKIRIYFKKYEIRKKLKHKNMLFLYLFPNIFRIIYRRVGKIN